MRIGLSDLHSLFLHLFSNFEALYLEVSNIICIFATEDGIAVCTGGIGTGD